MPDSGFIIDDISYEVPSLDSLNMDEAQILYDTSGLVLEDFAVDEDDPDTSARLQRNVRNPGFIRALMTIAYMRGNRGVSRAKAELLIGRSNLVEAVQNFIEAAGDESPPEETASANDELAVGNPSTSNDLSGDVSTSDSAEPVEIPEATGTSESDMSQDKARELLARGSRLT